MDVGSTVASIERAVDARRHFFLSNLATLSMKMARRMIEGDLGLAPKALDAAPFKVRVTELVDAVLAAGDGANKENTHAVKVEKPARPKTEPEAAKRKEAAAAKKPKRKNVIDSSDEDDDDDDDDEASMGGDASEEEADYDDSDSDGSDDGSDDDSDGSDDDSAVPSDSDDAPKKKEKKPAKKSKPAKAAREPKPKPKPKPAAKPITGIVAKLRDQCKKAGLTYQHVFMKRKDDAGRTELLERILADAGLSLRSDASEVAKVRRRVEREKDLDGIDAGAIIEGGRGRRAARANGWGEKIDYAKLNGKGAREKFGSDDDTTEDESSDEDDDDEDDVTDVEVAVTSDEDDDGDEDGEEEEDGDGGGDDDDEEEVAPMKKPKHTSAEKRKAPDASRDANAKPAPPPVKALKLERRIASPSPSPTPAKRPESAKPRVSEIGVVPGDVFFDSSDDDVDPPPAPRSSDEGREAPGEKRSPMRSDPAPAKKPARTVRPGGVLWSDSDED